jgi:hypothetical protein
MTTPLQLLSDMDAIAGLFANATNRPSWWSESYHASIATSLHREAWLEEVEKYPPGRTAQFLNGWEFDRLLMSGGRDAEISHANIAAYARHRMEEKAKPPRKPKKPERWRHHLRLVTGGDSE